MTFDQNGDSPARYELVNLQRVTAGTVHAAPVGAFDASLPSGRQFTMNGMKIVWGGGSHVVYIHSALFSHFWVISRNAIVCNI